MTTNEAFHLIRSKTGFTGPLWIMQIDHQTQDGSIAIRVRISGEDFCCTETDVGAACLQAIELLNKEGVK
jgi:hypothetical protein